MKFTLLTLRSNPQFFFCDYTKLCNCNTEGGDINFYAVLLFTIRLRRNYLNHGDICVNVTNSLVRSQFAHLVGHVDFTALSDFMLCACAVCCSVSYRVFIFQLILY
jgi:hypothetical protein